MGAVPQLGHVFDHYRLLEKLGEGGMGVVWLAEDTRLGRKVALKFLPPEAARDAGRLQRFKQEARAAAALSHPGIAAVHELAEMDGQTFIVFEYVPGSTLRSRVVPGGLQRDELLDIASDVADALATAHAAGVVHRDLKPENVMRTPAGNCKVLDFGLARISAAPTPDSATQTRSPLTTAGMVVGTVGYMAPEQLEGKEVDFRADIFSFGTLIYELATGVHPFQSGSSASTIAAIMKDEPPPLTQRNRLQPIELERIVRKCLRKRREERYQSTLDLAVDLVNLKRESGESGAVAGTSTIAKDENAARTWWWLHALGTICIGIPATIYLAWLGWQTLNRPWAEALLIGIVAAGATALGLRAMLLFSAVFMPQELAREVHRLAGWERGFTFAGAAGLFAIALGLFDAHVGLAVILAGGATFGLVVTQIVAPLIDRVAVLQVGADSDVAAARPAAPTRKFTTRRWWWWHNVLMCSVQGPLIVYLAFLGWQEAGVPWGRTVFIAEAIAVGLSVGVRATLLFFAFFEVPDFAFHLRRLGIWQRIAMLILACGLAALAVPLSDAHVGLAAILGCLAVLGLTGSELVEPAIARAAFPETGNHNHRDFLARDFKTP